MPTSDTPLRDIDRRVYLLLLDDQHQLMLCGVCCNGWTVPQVLLAPGIDFQGGAAQYLAERFRIHNPRFGSLYGVRETRDFDCWEHDRRTISHVFIVRISHEESDSVQEISPMHVRWGIHELKSRRREISPEGIVLLVSGYVEGWLPDGPITLH